MLCRSRPLKFGALLALTVLTFCSFIAAALGAEGCCEKRVALVIGNGNYINAPALSNPAADGLLVSDRLKDADFDSVTYLTDLTRDSMLAALRRFETEADAADLAVVYFAGHGLELDGVNYLVPVDATLETDQAVRDEAISMDQVLVALEGAKKLRVLILDACRSNPFLQTMKRTDVAEQNARGLGGMERDLRPRQRGTAPQAPSLQPPNGDPASGTVIVYAAKHGQIARDGNGAHSPFATALAQRLSEPRIEIRKLFGFVRNDVLEATDYQQEPFIYLSLSEKELYLNSKDPFFAIWNIPTALPVEDMDPSVSPAA